VDLIPAATPAPKGWPAAQTFQGLAWGRAQSFTFATAAKAAVSQNPRALRRPTDDRDQGHLHGPVGRQQENELPQTADSRTGFSKIRPVRRRTGGGTREVRSSSRTFQMWCQWVLWCNTIQARDAARSMTGQPTRLVALSRIACTSTTSTYGNPRELFIPKSRKSTRDKLHHRSNHFVRTTGSQWVLEGDHPPQLLTLLTANSEVGNRGLRMLPDAG